MYFSSFFLVSPRPGPSQLWKPDTWFSDHNVLTFLCAHDLAPVGEGIKVPCPRSNLEKWAPAIQVGIEPETNAEVGGMWASSLPGCVPI